MKTIKAASHIVRERGLGAQQCVDCGAVYIDPDIPKECRNRACRSWLPQLEEQRTQLVKAMEIAIFRYPYAHRVLCDKWLSIDNAIQVIKS